MPSFTIKGRYAEWYWNQLKGDTVSGRTIQEVQRFHEENYGADIAYSDFRNDFNNAPNIDELVINDCRGKVRGKHGGYYSTEYAPGYEGGSKPWEECRGMGMSFGYSRIENIDDYRTVKELVFMLVDIVSWGGNLLLNIGPRADGTIPVIMQDRLLGIGNRHFLDRDQ